MALPPPPLSTPPPPKVSEPAAKRNLVTAIFVGAIVIFSLVVVFIQLKDSWKGTGATVKPTDTSPPTEIPETSNVSERAMALADRLGNDASSLVGIIAQLNDRLRLAEEELAGTRALYTSSARKAGQLEREAATARLKSREVEVLRGQVTEARALLDVANRRTDALLAKLASSPDPATMRETEAMRDAFERELRETKIRLARDEAEKARLKADLSAATTELAATETALESTELFIESIELLPNAAKQLFLELSRLETVDRAELQKNYAMIARKIGARVVDKVSFETGSSEVDVAKAISIRSAMTGGKGNSFFLVIGYASKTGNFDINKKLSSERAKAVATMAAEAAKPEQMVRAVFLGQTDRFSDTNVYDDQICELWEIDR